MIILWLKLLINNPVFICKSNIEVGYNFLVFWQEAASYFGFQSQEIRLTTPSRSCWQKQWISDLKFLLQARNSPHIGRGGWRSNLHIIMDLMTNECHYLVKKIKNTHVCHTLILIFLFHCNKIWCLNSVWKNKKVTQVLEISGSRLPCKLLEYFKAIPAVDTAPIALPVRAKFVASLAVLSCKR